jgi:MOSC domain-containing protein YiiM
VRNALVDSASVGDSARFRPLDVLETQLAALPPAPRDAGRVRLIVKRGPGGHREVLARTSMTPESGVPGDAWGRGRHPAPEAQLTVMQIDVAELIANGQPLTLFGDNLFLELDLSAANLPPGSRLRAGTVTLEVTPEPHDGCRKFRARFGDAALQFVSKRDLRHLNLRGIYMRVVEGGAIAVDDPIQVLSRPLQGHAG